MSGERRTLYTLVHYADWEGGVTLFASRAELVRAVESDLAEANDRHGDAEEYERARADLLNGAFESRSEADFIESMTLAQVFIEEYGWKVQHYFVEAHPIVLP